MFKKNFIFIFFMFFQSLLLANSEYKIIYIEGEIIHPKTNNKILIGQKINENDIFSTKSNSVYIILMNKELKSFFIQKVNTTTIEIKKEIKPMPIPNLNPYACIANDLLMDIGCFFGNTQKNQPIRNRFLMFDIEWSVTKHNTGNNKKIILGIFYSDSVRSIKGLNYSSINFNQQLFENKNKKFKDISYIKIYEEFVEKDKKPILENPKASFIPFLVDKQQLISIIQQYFIGLDIDKVLYDYLFDIYADEQDEKEKRKYEKHIKEKIAIKTLIEKKFEILNYLLHEIYNQPQQDGKIDRQLLKFSANELKKFIINNKL